MTGRQVFVDVTLIGTQPVIHPLWEIGMLERRLDGSTARHQLFRRPALATADRDVLAAHRFYERTATWSVPDPRIKFTDTPAGEGWHDPAAVARITARATAGADLVRFEIADTATALDRFLRDAGQAPSWLRLIDVDVLIQGWEAGIRNVGFTDTEDDLLGEARSTPTAIDRAQHAHDLYAAVMSEGAAAHRHEPVGAPQ